MSGAPAVCDSNRLRHRALVALPSSWWIMAGAERLRLVCKDSGRLEDGWRVEGLKAAGQEGWRGDGPETESPRRVSARLVCRWDLGVRRREGMCVTIQSGNTSRGYAERRAQAGRNKPGRCFAKAEKNGGVSRRRGTSQSTGDTIGAAPAKQSKRLSAGSVGAFIVGLQQLRRL